MVVVDGEQCLPPRLAGSAGMQRQAAVQLQFCTLSPRAPHTQGRLTAPSGGSAQRPGTSTPVVPSGRHHGGRALRESQRHSGFNCASSYLLSLPLTASAASPEASSSPKSGPGNGFAPRRLTDKPSVRERPKTRQAWDSYLSKAPDRRAGEMRKLVSAGGCGHGGCYGCCNGDCYGGCYGGCCGGGCFSARRMCESAPTQLPSGALSARALGRSVRVKPSLTVRKARETATWKAPVFLDSPAATGELSGLQRNAYGWACANWPPAPKVFDPRHLAQQQLHNQPTRQQNAWLRRQWESRDAAPGELAIVAAASQVSPRLLRSEEVHSWVMISGQRNLAAV